MENFVITDTISCSQFYNEVMGALKEKRTPPDTNKRVSSVETSSSGPSHGISEVTFTPLTFKNKIMSLHVLSRMCWYMF